MVSLSQHFTYCRLLAFTIPSVIMLIVTSVYGVVDGLFVSNFVGKTAFTAVNFIFPFMMVLQAGGFMFGAGGNALIAKTMGEGNPKKANEVFSMVVHACLWMGILLMVFGVLLIRPISYWLGARGQMLEDSAAYGRIYLLGLPGGMLQMAFQYWCATAGKPRLGLYVTVAAGVANIALDALFVCALPWGLEGAAWASAISQMVGGLVPILYFARDNTSLLRLKKARYDWKAMGRVCSNGISELLSNMSMSLVGMLYNVQLLRYAGEDGVAAYGVLMYVCYVFLAIFIGFSVGVSPAVSFQFGAQNHGELRSLLKKSLVVIGIGSIFMCLLSEGMKELLASLYTGYDPELYAMTCRGFLIFSLSYLFSGIAIFGPAFFTALNNGPVSAVISVLRTLVFQVGTAFLFPIFWDVDGIWWSLVAAEFLAAVVTGVFLLANRKKYGF